MRRGLWCTQQACCACALRCSCVLHAVPGRGVPSRLVQLRSDHWFVLGSAALSEALRAGLPMLLHGEEGKAEGAGDAEGIGERWSTPGF